MNRGFDLSHYPITSIDQQNVRLPLQGEPAGGEKITLMGEAQHLLYILILY